MTVSVPEVEGGKVRLREWRATDVDFVLTVSNDPVIPIISQVPDAADRSGADNFIEAQRRRLQNGDGWAWAVELRDARQVVGYVGALWVSQAAGRASIGYWTHGDSRQRGIASEAVSLASDHLLAHGGVARLEAFIEPANVGSIRVAEAAGFEREGLMRSFAPLGGTRRDALLYARVAED